MLVVFFLTITLWLIDIPNWPEKSAMLFTFSFPFLKLRNSAFQLTRGCRSDFFIFLFSFFTGPPLWLSEIPIWPKKISNLKKYSFVVFSKQSLTDWVRFKISLENLQFSYFLSFFLLLFTHLFLLHNVQFNLWNMLKKSSQYFLNVFTVFVKEQLGVFPWQVGPCGSSNHGPKAVHDWSHRRLRVSGGSQFTIHKNRPAVKCMENNL